MIYGKKQFNPDGWWNDNLFLGIAGTVIFIILFLAIGFSIKFGYRKASSSFDAYQAAAPARAASRKNKKLIKDYKSGKTQKRVAAAKAKKKAEAEAVAKSTVKKVKQKRMARKGCPTLEEYLAKNPPKQWTHEELYYRKPNEVDMMNRDSIADAKCDWEIEYSDLMFNANGSLRDPCGDDNYSAEQSYWILALALYGVFVMWAGVGTGGNPIAIIIASLIGLLGAIVVFCF